MNVHAVVASLIGLALVAQSPPDTLGGASGLAGAGLLGGVLAWLLWVHLPALSRQAKEVTDAALQAVLAARTAADAASATSAMAAEKQQSTLAEVIRNKNQRLEMQGDEIAALREWGAAIHSLAVREANEIVRLGGKLDAAIPDMPPRQRLPITPGASGSAPPPS